MDVRPVHRGTELWMKKEGRRLLFQQPGLTNIYENIYRIEYF